ncbi:MAG: DUF1553 domain-containing protein [Roseibacillus sp. TMED18]|nr:MAG: DUF1553 domain-containing protein [Roseibacillus sp. TMED18]
MAIPFAPLSLSSFALATITVVLSVPALAAKPVEFAREIRPILSDTCFKCHGVDAAKRKGGLRLDQKEEWFHPREEGTLVVPGKPQESLVFTRITHSDPDDQMPPREEVRQLTPLEISKIRDWILQGANWQPHWSFVPLRRPALPKNDNASWTLGPIDRYIGQRMVEAGLQPAETADKATLLRRVTLDLTGLPPTLKELDTFLQDASEHAYERAVDRLLSSPRYGEHLAVDWLDLARYADTDGYQDDEPRTMWRWREWLINVLNDNMPFDQFTIEQLAGDLLPDATPEQRLATGFLRNNRVNGEGGSIAEEFRVEYIVDRVETVSSVWMGLTTGCARCHDHKYDPVSQGDFYSLFAFFNQTPEPGTYRRNAKPSLKVPTRPDQRRLEEITRDLEQSDDSTRKKLEEERKRLLDRTPETMIMEDSQRRDTFILERGQYDQRGQKVDPGVPGSLPSLPPGVEKTRLTLANWLIDSKHPLTARVIVNRLWQHHFGTGLVKSSEDFGVQGDFPSHPDLLDWLATELIRLNWDIKALQKLIVTSSTYCQSSHPSPLARKVDPENLLLSHSPQLRLSGEVIRDQALFVSGLLVEKIGGPSVKPYQPANLWNEIAGPTTTAYEKGYQQDTGEALYRRSLYTFWRRAIPPPGLQIFDGSTRETCIGRRERTNTPLQALALMNDITFVEAARGLATRMITEGGNDGTARLRFAFRLVTGRPPSESEITILGDALQHHLRNYQADAEAALELLKVGESAPPDKVSSSELAAYTALANTLLNLHETITRP